MERKQILSSERQIFDADVLTLFSAPLKGIIKQKRVKLEVKFMVV